MVIILSRFQGTNNFVTILIILAFISYVIQLYNTFLIIVCILVGNKQVNSVCMMESFFFCVAMEFYVKFGRTK